MVMDYDERKEIKRILENALEKDMKVFGSDKASKDASKFFLLEELKEIIEEL